MKSVDLALLEKLGSEWEAATPGLCVQAFHKGKKVVDIEVGETYRYYDWASLTKIVFSTTALMQARDAGRFRVSDPISRWVSWFPEDSPWRLRDLLSHSAGLTWWHPFYKDVIRKTHGRGKPEEAWRIFEKVLKRRVLADLRKQASAKVNRSKIKAVYSDLDFFLLGLSLEAIAEKPLYEAWTEVRESMGLEDVDFHRGNRPTHARKLYAPTERDAWRGKTLQGEVHDENTWALRGVAPHAGLFGPIDSLSKWGLLLRSGMRDEGRGLASHETVRLFTKRSMPRTRGDWALGFMMPTKGGASCGPLFSLDSVGHTGFTGTSLWYDPRRDLLVVILSNRVHPTRENKAFVALRPKLHTWIAEEL